MTTESNTNNGQQEAVNSGNKENLFTTDYMKAKVAEGVKNYNTSSVTIDFGNPGEKQIKASLIDEYIIEKNVELFATNPTYEEKKHSFYYSTTCTLIVYGSEGSGKKITAINAAKEIIQSPNTTYTEIRFLEIGERAGIDALREYFEGSIPSNCIFISRSSSDKVLLNFLETYQDSLVKTLNDEKCYLIVCTNEHKENLSHFSALKIGTEHHILEAIFEKQVKVADKFITEEWNEEIQELTIRSWNKLKQYLTKPIYIKMFCQTLLETKLVLDKEEITQIAIQIIQKNEEPSEKWFKRLKINEKIYAMQILLFESLTETRQDQFHIAIIDLIRSENIKNLQNPRSQGINDIKEKLKLRSTDDNKLEFLNNIYRHEVERQIENYKFLLLKLMDGIKKLVLNEYLTESMRHEMGSAIGKIGRFNHDAFEQTLDAMIVAGDNDSLFTAGFALSEMLKIDQNNISLVILKMEKWLNLNGQGEYGFNGYKGSCLAFFYVFEVINKEVTLRNNDKILKCLISIINKSKEIDLNALLEQVNHFKRQGYNEHDAIAPSIYVQLSERENFSKHATYSLIRNSSFFINDCLGNNENTQIINRCYPAILQAIHSVMYSVKREPLEERYYLPYFQYVFRAGEVGVSIEHFMMLITTWLQWPRWKKIIQEKILEMVLHGSEPLLWQIVDNISRHWLLSTNPEIDDIGNFILRKAWFMLGNPVLDQEIRVAIYVDGKRKSLKNRKVGLMLWNILKNYTTVELYEVGVQHKIADNHSKTYSLTQANERASIIMPSIATQHNSINFHLIFSDDPVIDLEDALTLKDRIIHYGELEPKHHPWLNNKIKPINKATNKTEPSQDNQKIDDLSRLQYVENYNLSREEIENIALVCHQIDKNLFTRDIFSVMKVHKTVLHEPIDSLLQSCSTPLDHLEEIITTFQTYLKINDTDKATALILELGADYPNIGRALSILLYKSLRVLDPKKMDHQILAKTSANMTSLGWSVALQQLLTWRFWLEQDFDWCVSIMSQRGDYACQHWNNVTTQVAALYQNRRKDIDHIWREKTERDPMVKALKLIKERFLWLSKVTGHQHSIELTTHYAIFIVDPEILKTTYAENTVNYLKQLMDFTWNSNKDICCILFSLGSTGHKKYLNYSDHQKTTEILIHEFLSEISKPYPRVVGPIIELCNASSMIFSIIMTKSKIIDLPDYINSFWAKKIFYLSFNSSLSTTYVESINKLSFTIEKAQGMLKPLIQEEG